MKDSTRRAVRTLYQGGIAAVGVLGLAVPVVQANIPAGDKGVVWKWLGTACVALVAVTALVSKVVNALEAAGKIPAWLKQPPATPTDPDPEDTPGRHAAPEPGGEGL